MLPVLGVPHKNCSLGDALDQVSCFFTYWLGKKNTYCWHTVSHSIPDATMKRKLSNFPTVVKMLHLNCVLFFPRSVSFGCRTFFAKASHLHKLPFFFQTTNSPFNSPHNNVHSSTINSLFKLEQLIWQMSCLLLFQSPWSPAVWTGTSQGLSCVLIW